ncbi:MAG: glycosyltransferase [Vitreoscilla sp.]
MTGSSMSFAATDRICFLLPEQDTALAALPRTIADYWQWQSSAAEITPYWGRYHWVLQSYLYLKAAGFPVTLCNEMPSQGVIITHFDCVDYGFRPSPEQILIVLLVDREVPHPRARLHVLHNPLQRLPLGLRHAYMPPWPQVGLVPRDEARADRFETVGYFGYEHNLHSDIVAPAFQEVMHQLGLRLVVPPPSNWHDFSNIDCIVAIRNFGRDVPHFNKPSLKLFNAWLAGVPVILGHETAYRCEGSPGLGYLEATSIAELVTALQVLKDDPLRRRALVEHGRRAVEAFSVERTVERWRRLLSDALAEGPEPRRGSRLATVRRVALEALRERVLWRRPGWFQ